MKKFLLVLLIITSILLLIFSFNKNKKYEIIDNVAKSENITTTNSNFDEKANQTNVTSKSVINNTINNKSEENETSKNEIVNELKDENNTSDSKSKETQTTQKNNNKKTIVIDPGHQTKGDSSKEPIGPGAKETKAKVTTGATGTYTKQKESELALKVSLLLEKELKQEGYNVIMTRKTNNVNISNSERAKIANDANADAFIRIHADSYDNSNVNRNVNTLSDIK